MPKKPMLNFYNISLEDVETFLKRASLTPKTIKAVPSKSYRVT
jgi:hypothetical protein